jgi:hypothetical protein
MLTTSNVLWTISIISYVEATEVSDPFYATKSNGQKSASLLIEHSIFFSVTLTVSCLPPRFAKRYNGGRKRCARASSCGCLLG